MCTWRLKTQESWCSSSSTKAGRWPRRDDGEDEIWRHSLSKRNPSCLGRLVIQLIRWGPPNYGEQFALHKAHQFINLNIFLGWFFLKREIDTERSICCSILPHIHWLPFVCAPTEDWTCNLAHQDNNPTSWITRLGKNSPI